MIEAQSSRSNVIYHVLYGPSELRVGWRLLIFLAIVIVLVNGNNFVIRRLLPGAEPTTLFLVRGVMNLQIFFSLLPEVRRSRNSQGSF